VLQNKFVVFILSVMCFSGIAGAQTGTVSPYSRYGIGEIRIPATVRQAGMGSAGKALFDYDRISILNPASSGFDTVTTLEAGIYASVFKLITSQNSQTANGASINYFSLGFPVIKNIWGAALGIAPYSSTGYRISDTGTSENCNCGRILSSFTGDGDINRYFLQFGFAPFGRRGEKFYTSSEYEKLIQNSDTLSLNKFVNRINAIKGISIGINASWLFGTLNNIRTMDFIDSTTYLDTKITSSITLSDIHLNFGALYHLELKKNNFINAGITLSPTSGIRSIRNVLWYNFRSNDFFDDVKDTVLNIVDDKGSTTIPMEWSAGVAFGKKEKWIAAADFTYQKWSEYKSFNVHESFEDSYSIHAGFEITPKKGSTRYLDNVQYRIGGYYGSSFLQLKGQRINDYGISIGLGIPVIRRDYIQRAALQIAFEAGELGTTSENLIKQKYYRVHFGVILNELWFVKRKYD